MNKKLVSLSDLCDLFPDIFTKNRLNYMVRNRDKNGFSRCLYWIGNQIYVELDKLELWLDSRNMSGSN